MGNTVDHTVGWCFFYPCDALYPSSWTFFFTFSLSSLRISSLKGSSIHHNQTETDIRARVTQLCVSDYASEFFFTLTQRQVISSTLRILQYYTMTLQRPSISLGNAGKEHGIFAPEYLPTCALSMSHHIYVHYTGTVAGKMYGTYRQEDVNRKQHLMMNAVCGAKRVGIGGEHAVRYRYWY